MAEITVNRTAANLSRALACATLASRRNQTFAASVEVDGRGQAAALLRCLAQRRAEQAEEHLRLLVGLEEAVTGGSTSDVGLAVCAAIASERERSAVYAGMARTARDEGFDEIAEWFEFSAKARRSHALRLQGALESLAGRGCIGFGR